MCVYTKCIHVCMHACAQMYVHVYVCACQYVYIYIYTHIHICLHVYVCALLLDPLRPMWAALRGSYSGTLKL